MKHLKILQMMKTRSQGLLPAISFSFYKLKVFIISLDGMITCRFWHNVQILQPKIPLNRSKLELLQNAYQLLLAPAYPVIMDKAFFQTEGEPRLPGVDLTGVEIDDRWLPFFIHCFDALCDQRIGKDTEIEAACERDVLI